MSEQDENVNMAPLHDAREALLTATQKFNSWIEASLTTGNHDPFELLALADAMQKAWDSYDDMASTYANRVRETQTLGRKMH